MEDYLISATAFDGTIDIIAVETTNISEYAKGCHKLSKVSNIAFTQTLTGAILMSSFIKNEEENLVLEINGNGECGKILAIVNSNLDAKGYIENTNVELDDNNFSLDEKIGKCGYIKVIKDMKLKEPYVGITAMQTGDISKDLTYYYNCSEQIMSYLTIEQSLDNKKNIKRMCGILIQVMPDVKHETIKYLNDNLSKFELFPKFVSDGNTLEDIIIYIFKKENLKFKNKRLCRYKCDCSREKMLKGLVSLGKRELIDIVNEDNEANVECHFCNKKYVFKKDELKNIIETM